MRFKLRYILPGIFLAGAVFFVGPSLGQRAFRWMTPDDSIEKWKSDAQELDVSDKRTEETEMRRYEILRQLGRRGIYPDGGITDEAIEHHLNPYTLTVMTVWRWRDFLGTR